MQKRSVAHTMFARTACSVMCYRMLSFPLPGSHGIGRHSLQFLPVGCGLLSRTARRQAARVSSNHHIQEPYLHEAFSGLVSVTTARQHRWWHAHRAAGKWISRPERSRPLRLLFCTVSERSKEEGFIPHHRRVGKSRVELGAFKHHGSVSSIVPVFGARHALTAKASSRTPD